MTTPWQPIETAPKDGTAILIYADDDMFIVRWVNYPSGSWWHIDDGKHGPYALRGPEPTYWMPLPQEPNTHGNQ